MLIRLSHASIHSKPAASKAGAKLSPRQQEVHELLLLGMSNGKIVRRLGLSKSTVKVHVSQVFRKKGVRSRIELLVKEHAKPTKKAA